MYVEGETTYIAFDAKAFLVATEEKRDAFATIHNDSASIILGA
jgi:hypothetical protein